MPAFWPAFSGFWAEKWGRAGSRRGENPECGRTAGQHVLKAQPPAVGRRRFWEFGARSLEWRSGAGGQLRQPVRREICRPEFFRTAQKCSKLLCNAPRRFANSILVVIARAIHLTSVTQFAKGGFETSIVVSVCQFPLVLDRRRGRLHLPPRRDSLAATWPLNFQRARRRLHAHTAQPTPFDRCRPTGLRPGRLVTTASRCSPSAQDHFHSPRGALMIDQT